jgi:hypothetical protein
MRQRTFDIDRQHWANRGLKFAMIGQRHGSTLMLDSSVSRNHCRMAGLTAQNAWKYDSTLCRHVFVNDGAPGHYAYGTQDPLRNASACSFGCWAKVTGTLASLEGLFTTLDSGYAGGICLNYYDTIGKMAGQVHHSYSNYVTTGVAPPFDWTHFFFTYDGTTFTSYVNGEYVALSSRPAKSISDNNPIRLSALLTNSGSYTPDAEIADVLIYDRVLSATEIWWLGQRWNTTLSGLICDEDDIALPSSVFSDEESPAEGGGALIGPNCLIH